MRKNLVILFIGGVVLLFASFKEREQIVSGTRFKSNFRYLIVSNFAKENLIETHSYRTITILIDESEFNLTRLRELNSLICKRFPTPTTINTTVYTSLNQIMTPEEIDYYGGKEGESPINENSSQLAYIQNRDQSIKITIRSAPRGDIVSVTNLPRLDHNQK